MKRVGGFLAIFAVGMLVFLLGGYWGGVPPGLRGPVKGGLFLVLLGVTVALARRGARRDLRHLSLGFLAASAAFLAAHWMSDPLLGMTGASPVSPAGLALAKLCDALPIVLTILLVARLGGLRSEDLFLTRGKVRAWLSVGLASFAGFSLLLAFQASREGLGSGGLLGLVPWILIFVLSNAFMEELHFRGLLLKPTQGLLGRHGANLCIALVFTLTHGPVRYTAEVLPFLVVLMGLALAWGYLIQRTDTLWGAVLFHAGADLVVILDVFNAYGARL